MLTPDRYHTKVPPPPNSPRGRCPGCGASGPLVVDRRGGRPRPVVFTCTCPHPPAPVEIH